MNKLICRCPKCKTFLVPSTESFINGIDTEYSLFCMKCNKNLKLEEVKNTIENDLDIYEIVNTDVESEKPVVLRVDNNTITFESPEQAKAFLQLDVIKSFIQDTNILIRKIDPSLYFIDDGGFLLTTNCILLDDNIVIPS